MIENVCECQHGAELRSNLFLLLACHAQVFCGTKTARSLKYFAPGADYGDA